MVYENIITTSADLLSLVTEAKYRDAIALDTEFVWERTYYPQLGLIQLALSDEECYLIDPLAIDDLRPLGELLSTTKVVKIFHDAPQDLAILAKATNSIPCNIFDTRMAAGFAGLPATLSLANLIGQLLDIKLDKSSTRTNWLQRPLSPQQLLYAAEDVRYLRAIRVVLLARITTPSVKKWLNEELAILDNPQTYDFFNPKLRYKKIKGLNKLNSNQRSLLKELYIWRENHARQKNRPRGHIVQDAALLEMAIKEPQTTEELKKSSLSAKAVNRYAGELLTIMTQDRSEEKREQPHYSKTHKMSKREREALTALDKYSRLKSEALGIDHALVANQAELKKLAKTIAAGSPPERDSRLAEGWRREFINDFIA